MLKKILIANRGEIACRVIKTARRMGIATVAVYSDSDSRALHVQMADEAFHIGPSPARESYLDIDRLMGVVAQSGVDSVHPGYGFLSENRDFAERLAAKNVIFIGPPANAIEVMGDKITSKKLALKAGVNTVPGYMGLVDDVDQAITISREIGYPVMIKASAGGGGKGMRVAYDDEAVREGFKASQNEALASFGDDRIFIEKFIAEPRHIEIQVLGDQHGNLIHLGERECSIQRRNQKVIEEAPSPFLNAKMRDKMGAQALALADACGYYSAGTVEFIVDRARHFYFLEMNTRLQVEHPVTESITGIDLVEQMFRIAAGEKLGLKQDDVVLNGWALEARVYAEDPYSGFLPSTGRLVHYIPPRERQMDEITVRNDTGVYDGGEISVFYDPMITKLITHAPKRTEAISVMIEALDAFHISGIRHNIDFLTALMIHPRFQAGKLTTRFIEDEYPDGFKGTPLDAARAQMLAAVGFHMHEIEIERAAAIDQQISDSNYCPSACFIASIGTFSVTVARQNGDASGAVMIDDHPIQITSDWRPGDVFWRGQVGDQKLCIIVARSTEGYLMIGGGARHNVILRTPEAQGLVDYMSTDAMGVDTNMLLCPMPGAVVSLAVNKGDQVKAGTPLMVVEAMKMENILRAEHDAVIAEICCTVGDKVAVDDVLIKFEEPEN